MEYIWKNGPIFFSTFLPIACGIKYFSFQLVSSLHDFLKYCYIATKQQQQQQQK